jgi:hypothetical protein
VLEWAPDVNQTPLERSIEVARLIDDDAKLNERRVAAEQRLVVDADHVTI